VWASLGDYDLRPDIQRLSVPAVVVQGENDPIPLEASRTVAQLLAGEFHSLPRCGHVPYVEAFDEFVAIVGGFLPAQSREARPGTHD
jgi:pimeloyl-ACP methyl ester carboxylesterase